MEAGIVIIAAAAAAAGLVRLWRRGLPGLPGSAGSRERKRLVKMCFGDEEKALRLMRREMKQDPGIGEREAYRRAVQRYRRHLG
jgi:hypothetical protein